MTTETKAHSGNDLKLKYVGGEDECLTEGETYDIVAWVAYDQSPRAIIMTDDGKPYVTQALDRPDMWEVVDTSEKGTERASKKKGSKS